MWLLRGRLGGLDDRRVLVAFGKVLVASAAMAAVAWGIAHGVEQAWPVERVAARLARVGLAVGGGLVTLAVAARVLQLHEFEVAFRRVTSRLVRR